MKNKISAILLALVILISGCFPACAETVPSESESIANQIIHLIAEHLLEQDYTLDYLTPGNSYYACAGSDDGTSIVLEFGKDDIAFVEWLIACVDDGISMQINSASENVPPREILFSDTQVTFLYEDEQESYSYYDIPEEIFGSHLSGLTEQIHDLIGTFSESDLTFLKHVGITVYDELSRIGAIPRVRSSGDGTYFSLNLAPDLILNAAVRIAEQLLNQYPLEIDSLLLRSEPVLRKLIPELYRVRDPQLGTYTTRETLTYNDLRELFQSWFTKQWLRSYLDFEGMHLDLSGFIGNDQWRIDADFQMYSESLGILLNIQSNGDNSFEGTLEYRSVAYSRASERYEPQCLRFNIDGILSGGLVSMSVRPETPIDGFTGLRLDLTLGAFGFRIDASCDIFDLQMKLDYRSLDLSAIVYEYLLDMQLTFSGNIPTGFVTFKGDSDGFRLNINN